MKIIRTCNAEKIILNFKRRLLLSKMAHTKSFLTGASFLYDWSKIVYLYLKEGSRILRLSKIDDTGPITRDVGFFKKLFIKHVSPKRFYGYIKVLPLAQFLNKQITKKCLMAKLLHEIFYTC